MAASSSSTSSPQVLEVPPAAGQIAAIGPAGGEGVFVALVLGGGIQYIHISGKRQWVKAALSSESVTGSLGLHVHSANADEAKFLHVSFVDGSQKTWICLRIPAAPGDADIADAEEVGRLGMPSEVAAACSSFGDPAAALALRSGAVRFVDLSTGAASGKGLKLEPSQSKGEVALVRLAPYRVALVRGAPSSRLGVEFFVVTFDQGSEKAVLHLQGSFDGGDPLGTPVGPFAGAAAVEQAGAWREDRVVLRWHLEEGREQVAPSSPRGHVLASTVLNQESPKLTLLPASPGAAAWSCVRGYIAEWSPARAGAGAGAEGGLELTVRDARFGMTVASSAAVPLPAADRNVPRLMATSGGVTLMVGRRGAAAQVLGVHWLLPGFSLQMLIGRGPAAQPSGVKALVPLREAVSGKRQRDDPAVEDMFSSKRHAATDRALAAAVKERRWAPSLELVNEIIYRRSWAAACALLSLPELDEDLSVKLLSARPELLARVVRRARAPHLLEPALRDNLPASQLPKLLEVLLQWLDAYRDFSQATLRREAPGLPELQDVVTFLGALADGCLPMLAQLEVDLLERTLEALMIVQKRSSRITHLYATLREAYRIRKPLRPVAEAPAIEVVFFDDF
mmetsp:Transcript_106590/g.318564  ORF Transcript_106590/g.318564 Transcript_106590/m.318564 type:complete len:623 (+) Transcript_106590:97-1965(+)